MTDQPKRHEFKVVIEGIALSPETVHSIDQAVRTTVMHELANIDLNESLALAVPQNVPEDVLAGRFGFPTDVVISGMFAQPVDFGDLFG